MQVPGVATVTHHARVATRIAPGGPAIWLGLRTAAATGLPLLLAPWLDPAAATWAPLAGYTIALIDKGGAYRVRARSMAIAALGSLLAVILGTLVAGTGVLALAVVTLGLTACAFGHAWSAAGASIGNTIALHLTIAAFLPIGAGGLGYAVSGFAAGAGWAMFLGLVVWPVRVYKPGRRAVASVLGAIADHAASVAQLAVDPDGRDGLIRAHRAIRERLEIAREILAATRRGRRGETGRGERLLAIIHACDHLFGQLVALEEVLDARLTPAAEALIAQGLARSAAALRELAERVAIESRLPPPTTPAWEPGPAATTAIDDARLRPRLDHALLLLGRVQADVRRAGRLIDSLVDDTEPLSEDDLERDPAPTIRERLAAVLHLDSAVLRHALRVAITVGAAAALATYLELHHGYWITITTYLLLQPSRAATTTRAVQRGLGTVLGAMIAAGIAWMVRDPLVMMAIIVVLAGTGASVLQLNYALYSLFITPTFVLLAEVHTQDFTLVEVRIVYTLIGGALAFVASAALWPSRESVRFGDQMAHAVEAVARYFGAVRTAIATQTPSPSATVIATRRTLGIAVNNAETALDRVIAERVPTERLEPRMTMVMAVRRLGGAINVLGSTRAVVAYGPHEIALLAYARAIEARLDELAMAIRTGEAPPPWPFEPPRIPDLTITARLDRIQLQLGVLAEAATRAARTETPIADDARPEA